MANGQEPAVRVFAQYQARIAHIETVGHLHNGQLEIGSGSGLLIGNDLVLTNDHVVPLESNYKQLQLFVRLQSRLSDPIAVRGVTRDAELDLALLEVNAPVAETRGSRCPIPIVTDPSNVPAGTSIFVLGYPLNQNLSITSGIVSNLTGGKGRWQTDSVMNPGNSGGPVFNSSGALVGVAVGGIVSWRSGEEIVHVNGVNFLIPSVRLRQSPLYAKILEVPDERRCWSEANISLIASESTVPASSTMSRSYTVSETKDDHPVVLAQHSRNYEKQFHAEPGYRVTSCSFVAQSANNSSEPFCNILPGGKSAIFQFRLTSGPAVDRWRGWWLGSVVLQQARID